MTLNFTEASDLIETFRTQTSREVYSKYNLDQSLWQNDLVKHAFDEVKHFINTELSREDLNSSLTLDLKLMHVMERNVSEGMSMSQFQAVFIALILEALDKKKHDEYGRKHASLLRFGYRCRLLSFFLSQMLRDGMVDFVIGMYKNEEARYGVLSFFELV